MASNKQSDEQNLPPRKPRRSVIRSLSWKRASKRSKMDDNEQEAGFEASGGASIDTTIETPEDVGATPSSPNCLSDEDAEETVFNDSTASSSKKRKKSGVWKAVKRLFSRKSDKGSKSFTAGDSRSPSGQPQRSVSDPNLLHQRVDRPDVAPLQQVDGATAMPTPPKKAVSHGNLMSELRSRQGGNVDFSQETSISRQEVAIVQSRLPDIDWQASPTEVLLPGLNVSHDKIRVAPRHRRAPSRKGVASVRQRGEDITDGNVQNDVIVEQPEPSEQELDVQQRERENLKERMKMEEEQRKRQQEQEDEEKLKQVELEKQKLEQENLEQEIQRELEQLEQEKLEQEIQRELEQLEQERLEKEKIEEEKRQMEKLEKEKLEQEKLEMEKLEQEKLEKEKLEQEKLENEKREQERLDEQKLEQERLEKEKIEQERLENEKLEQEKQKLEQGKLDKQKLEQERLEKEKNEQERLEKEKLQYEQQKLEQQKRELENIKQETAEEEKRIQFNTQPTTDFSDLAKSLRPSDDAKETYSVELTEPTNIEETTTGEKHQMPGDMNDASALETPGIALDQNTGNDEVNVHKEETLAALDIEMNNATNDAQTTSEFTASPLIKAESATPAIYQEIRETNEVDVAGRSEKSVSEENVHLENITGKPLVEVLAVDNKTNDDKTVVIVEKDKSPPLSPHAPTSPQSPTPLSPGRSRRLVIETPEEVYQKPIMPELRIEESNEKPDGSKGIKRNRPQSMHNRLRPEVEQHIQTQDDSNLGVARLTQAFERSSRSQTISYSDRKKKPDVLPKPKPGSKQSQTLDKNFRFPSATGKPSETETPKSPKKQSNIVVLDELPEKAEEKKASVPTKKPPAPKPKPLPKPKIKPTLPNATTKKANEDKENIKKTTTTSSVTNGSVKKSDLPGEHAGDGAKDEQTALPSFWARRNIFSPEQKANNSTPSQDEKPKEKHAPFIQLKTDTCAVCGSKVYQMEKFKVKDNIVHRSCIKCSVCKRLLSVGNFIMSQNKIYCKPHEPSSVPIPMATV